jgi:hypothetical protein
MAYNPGMYARRFESLLAEEVGKTDLSQRAPDDMPLRFESLRGYRLLPSGRMKNVTPLSLAQMATAILAIATVKPGYAGLAGKTLSSLRPVGGVEASFQRCVTLGSAVQCLLQSPAALESFLELRVSDSEIYANAHGRGAITYVSGDDVLTAHYVHQNARSLFHAGAEEDFDPRALISSAVTEMVFYQPFFQQIVGELTHEASGQFQGGRRAVCLGKITIERQVGRESVGRADHGIEVAVGVATIEQGVVAEFVGQGDLGEVETAASGDRKSRSNIERVGRVDPRIESCSTQSDRRHIARRLVDKETGTLHRRKLVGIDRSQFARGRELRQATVDTHSEHKIVFVTEHFLRGGRLHGAAEAVGCRPGTVDLAQDACSERAGGWHRLPPGCVEIRQRAIEIGKA